MDQPVYHIPALLGQTIAGLDVKPGGTYIDCTYGGGGHSHRILELLGNGRLFGFDQDMDAIERAEKDPHLTMVHGNFRYMANFMRYNGVLPGEVDGILADLGVSFHHFDDADRGFSFRWDGPLDMRMNRSAGSTAEQILNTYTEEQLSDMFYICGEMKNSRKIASAIVKARGISPLKTTNDLLQAVKPLINPKQERKELAQVFQALRITVNDEFAALRELLTQSLQMLKSGGRLAIITYHSLEDRLVKNFLKTGNFEGKVETDFFGRRNTSFKLITSKPILPDENEIESNPRSRSAKLRVAEKV